MTFYCEDPKSVSISDGIKGVRILLVTRLGEEVEFLTNGNKLEQIKP